jgi:polyhydroxybutyrate depolymerase
MACSAACDPAVREAQERARDAVRVGDTVRTYVLDAPVSADSGAPIPLLLVFHGTGERGPAMRRRAGFDTLPAARSLLVAYPDAAVGNWAEGCACSRADLLGINDTGFVRALVADVARRYPVDHSRVYAVGFSQGGVFVHRLACQMADLVAGVASVASPMSAVMAEQCRPTRPVAVLVLQGTLDDAYPYEGERRREHSVLGARETADIWRVLDGCARDAVGREWPDRAADGTRMLEERWAGCRDGVEVALVSVEGGRHAWSLSADVSTPALVWEFLARQRRLPHRAR